MILVTGGTGLIGSHLLLELLQKENSVRAIYRTKDSLERVQHLFSLYEPNYQKLFEQIEWMQADLLDVPALSEAFINITAVYHCAALISFDSKENKNMYRINVVGTANVVNCCITHKVKKLAHISSIAAIGASTKGQVVTEKTPWNQEKATPYGDSKRQAELEIWRGKQEGIDTFIVNPGVVIGPGFWKQGSGQLFMYASKEKSFFPPGGTGFVAVEDVVKALTLLMKSDLPSDNYILVGANASYEKVLTTIARFIGAQPPKKPISALLLELTWRVDWLGSVLIGSRRKLTKKTARTLYTFDKYSSDRIRTALDFQFKELEISLSTTSEKFKADYQPL